MNDIAAITVDTVGSPRLRTIRCPECGMIFARWYRGSLRVGGSVMTDMRLSGYRKLAAHLEDEHEQEGRHDTDD